MRAPECRRSLAALPDRTASQVGVLGHFDFAAQVLDGGQGWRSYELPEPMEPTSLREACTASLGVYSLFSFWVLFCGAPCPPLSSPLPCHGQACECIGVSLCLDFVLCACYSADPSYLTLPRKSFAGPPVRAAPYQLGCSLSLEDEIGSFQAWAPKKWIGGSGPLAMPLTRTVARHRRHWSFSQFLLRGSTFVPFFLGSSQQALCGAPTAFMLRAIPSSALFRALTVASRGSGQVSSRAQVSHRSCDVAWAPVPSPFGFFTLGSPPVLDFSCLGACAAIPRCNGAFCVGSLDGRDEALCNLPWRLRSKSVALGCSPGEAHALGPGRPLPTGEDWLGRLPTWLVDFMRSLCGIFLLLQFRLLLWCCKRGRPRKALDACMPRQAVLLQAVVVFGSVASEYRHGACLPWRSDRPGTSRRLCRVGSRSFRFRITWACLWLLGGTLPHVVFSAPVGATTLATDIEEWCANLPQPLPPPHTLPNDLEAPLSGATRLSPYAGPSAEACKLTCVVFETGQVAQSVEICLNDELTSGRVLVAASEAMPPTAFPSRLVHAVPSFGRGYVPLVAVYDWVLAANKTVFVVNLEACGGPIFAVCDWEFVSYRSVEVLAARFLRDEWQVYFGSAQTPMVPGDSVLAFPGVVFTFVPPGAGVPSASLLEASLHQPGLEGRDLEAAVYQDRPTDKWLLLCSHVARVIEYSGPDFEGVRALVADAIPAFADEIMVSDIPLASPLLRVNFEGTWVKGVLAATPKHPDTLCASLTGVFVLIDVRSLGRRPAVIYTSVGWNAVEDLIGEIGLRPPTGFDVQILGVPVQGLSFHIAESCTISVGFVPVTPQQRQVSDSPPCLQVRRPVRERNVVVAALQEGEVLEAAPTPVHIPQGDAPLIRIPIRVRPDDPPPPTFLHGGFVVLSLRYKPEILQLVLRVPCEVNTALQEIEEARDAARVELFGTLLAVEPQPDTAFAVLLAVPDWADTCRCVVVDARQLDDRLFSWILPEFMSRDSLLAELGVQDVPGLRIYRSGRLLTWTGGRQHRFWQGVTISLVPAGCALPRMGAFAHMLRSSRDWHIPCPYFGGRPGTSLLTLSDTVRRVVDIDVNTIRSTRDFKQVAVTIFAYRLHLLTVCPTVPRLDDVSELGQDCHAIIAVTEQLPRVPIPPGLWQPKQHLVFLDRRPLLQACTWFLAQDGRICYDSLIAPYTTAAPAGFRCGDQGRWCTARPRQSVSCCGAWHHTRGLICL